MRLNSINLRGLFVAMMTSFCLCQNSTVSLYLPGGDESEDDQLVGAIIASDATATTYAFHCASTADYGSVCDDFPGTVTITEGPAIAKITIPATTSGTSTGVDSYQSCSLDPVHLSAVCLYVASQSGEFISLLQTISGTDYTLNRIVITSTATSTPSSNKAAGAMITGAPAWVVGGAASAVAAMV